MSILVDATTKVICQGFTGWERGLQSWDIAAGLLLVKEAGGLIEPINIENDVLKDGELIAGNEISFEKFSKIIRNR